MEVQEEPCQAGVCMCVRVCEGVCMCDGGCGWVGVCQSATYYNQLCMYSSGKVDCYAILDNT